MDKYEFNLKVDQMKKLAGEGDYTTAMKIADGIDWRRVPNVALLTRVSEIYEACGEAEEARQILLLAYERAPMGKGLLFHLAELSLQAGETGEAEKCFREFQDLAPNDPRVSLLRYEILKAKNVAASQLIEPLERYNASQFDEKWMYELAEVYHRAERHEECVNMCDRISLLFGTGPYVEKALALKSEGEGVPLSEYQRNLLQNKEENLARLQAMKEEFRKKDEMPVPASDAAFGGETAGTAAAGFSAADAGERAGEGAQRAGGAAGYASYGETADRNPAFGGTAGTPAAGAGTRKAGKDEGGLNGLKIPEFVLQEPMEEFDEGAAPAEQSEIDREIEEHLAKIEAEQKKPGLEARQNAAAAAAVEAAMKGAAEPAAAAAPSAAEPETEAAPAASEPETEDAPESQAVSAEPETVAAPELQAVSAEPAAEPAEAAIPESPEASGKPAAEPVDDITRVLPKIGRTTAAKAAETALTAEDAEIFKTAGTVRTDEKAETAEDIGETKVLPDLKAIRSGAKEEQAGRTETTEENKDASAKETGETADEGQEAAAAAEKAAVSAGKETAAAAGKEAVPDATEGVPRSFNCFMEGRTPEEGLNAAITELRRIHAETGSTNAAAKIRADRLNVRGVAASASKISGKDLIIEDAGDLTEKSVQELLALVKEDAGERTVILADNPLQLTRLAEHYPELADAFHADKWKKAAAEKADTSEPAGAAVPIKAVDTVKPVNAVKPERAEKAEKAAKAPEPERAKDLSRKNAEAAAAETAENKAVPDKTGADAGKAGVSQAGSAASAYTTEELSVDAFAEYAREYAKKIDCVISGKSMLALYERVEIMQEDGVALTRKNAEALIEEVADRAEKPPLLKRIGGIFSRKYDKDGMLILKEDDF